MLQKLKSSQQSSDIMEIENAFYASPKQDPVIWYPIEITNSSNFKRNLVVDTRYLTKHT